MGVESLHLHTHSSDGQFSHEGSLNEAAKNGISVIAFTDHDAVPSLEIAQKLVSLKDHETKWIMGIELSSGLPRELGNAPYSNLHIVGLGVNPFDQSLREHCQLAQEARIERMRRIVGNLQNLGFIITEQDCLDASGGEVVGRPHIVKALELSENKHNKNVLLELKKRVEIEAEHDSAVRERYITMVSRGEKQFPYDLFLIENAFVPDVYVDYLYWTDLDTSVDLIRKAGGLAVIAHYWTVMKKVPLENLGGLLQNNRLDGAETVYGLGDYLIGSENKNLIDSSRAGVQSLVKKHGKLATGGADIHRREDFENFASSGWYAQETVGMGRNVVSRLDKSNPWHSLSY